MADNKTTYLENKILDHVLRNTAYTPPSGIFIGLFTATPGESGGGTEVSATSTGYTRRPVNFDVATNGATKNSGAIVFNKSTAAWGTITHFALFDASTGGNMLFYGPLSTSVAISAANMRVEFEDASIIVTES